MGHGRIYQGPRARCEVIFAKRDRKRRGETKGARGRAGKTVNPSQGMDIETERKRKREKKRKKKKKRTSEKRSVTKEAYTTEMGRRNEKSA